VVSPVYTDDNPSGTQFDINNINVRVSDDDTGVGIASTTLRINNVAPTITAITSISGVDSNGNAVACYPVTFQVTLTDPSPAATETFRYEFDWNNDGTVDEVFPTSGFTAARSITISHEFDVTTTFRVRAVDDDTGVSAWQSFTITVLPVTIIGGNLVVGGSNSNDNIVVNGTNPAAVSVIRNGVTYSPFNLSGGGHVIIHGCDGNDIITVNGAVSAELYGDDGNDILYGGSGNDVIWGGNGDDVISLGGGDDVGIGGLGRDQLNGGNGNDVEVGGDVNSTVWTWSMFQGPGGVIQAWNSWNSTGTPPAQLTNLRDATTDTADIANYDRFWGNTGKDCFVYRSGTGGDQINDYSLAAKDYLLALL
jgi:Ca2+-binding RTX toxin-like protein